MADFPANCSNCGAAIYAQWWSNAEKAYRCRVCGTLNPGLRPELTPVRPASRALVAFLILVWGVLVVWGLYLMQSLSSYLRSPSDFEGGETGLFWFLFPVVGVPWLVVLVITAVATWRLRRSS